MIQVQFTISNGTPMGRDFAQFIKETEAEVFEELVARYMSFRRMGYSYESISIGEQQWSWRDVVDRAKQLVEEETA